MKKILIATRGLSSTGQMGGISSYTHDLATNMVEWGNEVQCFLIEEDIDESLYLDVTYKYQIFNIKKTYGSELDLINKILMQIEIFNPDIIINNDTSYLSGLWPVLKMEIVKISVMHGFKLGFALSNSGITGKMSTLNHNYVDYIVCQNSKMVVDCVKKYNIKSNKVVFIPQSFREKDTRREVKKSQALKIIFANGHNISKGADIMYKISKMLSLSNMKFQVSWCRSKGLAEFLKDDRFQFYNNLERNQFVEKLRDSDVIIIPTKLDTGPMLLVEAMSNGVVPICNALETSSIPDVVIHGKNGFVVSKNNPREFYRILEELNEDRDNLISMQKEARFYYQNNLSDKIQKQNFEKIFNKQEFRKPVIMSDANYVFFHLKRTSNLPKYSLKRIYLKVRYALELPLYKNSIKI